jgi:hypothetical protein
MRKPFLSLDYEIVGECWEYSGSRDPNGYPRAHRRRLGEQWAHRVAWIEVNGPIPEGMFVLHICDNPPCIRPEHLHLGTQADNMADKVARGRQSYGESGNAVLTEDDVRLIRWLLSEGYTQKEIAQQFSVRQPRISNISRGKSWAWLDREVPTND